MTDKSKKPAITRSRASIREALDNMPIEHIVSNNGKGRNLTKKQKGFIRDVAMGIPKAQAYRNHYNTHSSPKRHGNDAIKLSQNPMISREIEAFRVALLAREYQKSEQLKAFIMHQLTQHSLDPEIPPAQRIKSLELLGKTYEVGLFVDRKEITTVNNTSEIKEKLLEKLKEAMKRNEITIEHDEGDELLRELADARENATPEPHPSATPSNDDGRMVDDMHSIPHKESAENNNENQTDTEYNESNTIDVNAKLEVSKNTGGYPLKEISVDEKDGDLVKTPLDDLEQK